MPSSDSEHEILEEIAKMKKKIKKLSRRRRHRRDSRHRSRHSSSSRSRSRHRSRLSPIQSPPVPLLPSTEELNTMQQGKENVDPVIITDDHTAIPDELLTALGNDMPVEEKYGPDINTLIGARWENIILNDSEEIKDLLKLYKIPKNCPLLEAPELNPEVKAALTDSARNRDQILQVKQQQLGIALACLGQAMSNILAGHEIPETLKLLSDGTKLLTSLHHKETDTRKQLLAPLLDKSFIKMAETIKRNQYLFGENLIEKIKNSKEIEKSGLQLKKPKQPIFNRPGNWAGPSRQNIQQKSGPRGGQKRQPAPQTKKSYQPPRRPSKRAPTNRSEKDYQRARHRR